MLLQEPGERPLQLAGAVAVNEPDRRADRSSSDSSRNRSARVERFVDACSRSRSDRDGAPRAAAARRSRCTRRAARRLRRRRSAGRGRSARIRLPRTSRSAVPSWTAVTTAFEAEPADDHAVADATGGCRRRRGLGAGRRRRLGSQESLRARCVDRGARVAARRAGVAGRDQPRRRLARAPAAFAFSVRDDVVDLARAPARTCVVELLVQPAPERLLALRAAPSSRCVHPRLGRVAASRARARPGAARARARACRGRSSRGARPAALRARSGSARAAATTDGLRPRRAAISSARLRPGDP